ncbi:hypothetical protein LTR62_001939 [Meristemomyces frigidus]|uniref:Deacetylase sirtuin-type domain-containing protein n=1 Tax=Meristemomyces frigidus TaxID=1508187 RepID=A0AAN7T7K7_9PEZI|nr:hypothetical protein LTR62_001939 [Meristemomyces frigidus]
MSIRLVFQSNAEEMDLATCLKHAERIMVVAGAGLSRPSGLPTFRQDAHFWEGSIDQIATRAAFQDNFAQIWARYERFRQLALDAPPNEGHYALARLAAAKPGLLFVTQNIDERSERAGHSLEQLVALHGSVFDVKCTNVSCSFTTRNNSRQAIIPFLTTSTRTSQTRDLEHTPPQDPEVPTCHLCNCAKLRPGMVWFGEVLPPVALSRVERWLQEDDYVDLYLIIGTERTPFMQDALDLGAKVAWFDIFHPDDDVDPGDATWIVSGDASETVPSLVEEVLQ